MHGSLILCPLFCQCVFVRPGKAVMLKIVCSVAHSLPACTDPREGAPGAGPQFPSKHRWLLQVWEQNHGLMGRLILCKFVLNHMQNLSTNKNEMSAHKAFLYFKNKLWNRLCYLNSIQVWMPRLWNFNGWFTSMPGAPEPPSDRWC